MKKQLLILTFFIQASTFLCGQTNVYHPFPDSNAVWTIHLNSPFLMCTTAPSDFFYSYVMTGDTTIGSYTYHKVIVPYLPSNNCFGPQGTIIGFRQDIPNKKVFGTLSGNPIDTLLYDFNLQVGDTVKGYIAQMYCSSYPAIVSSIDSVLVGSNYRKRWELNIANYIPIYLLEGIGSSWDLQAISCSSQSDEVNYNLYCFQENGITLYPNATTNCDIVLSANPYEKNIKQMEISPNPFSTKTTLGTKTILIDANLTIYNLYGQIVKQIDRLFGQAITLLRDNLPSGLYIIQLTQDNKIISTEKLVISDN